MSALTIKHVLEEIFSRRRYKNVVPDTFFKTGNTFGFSTPQFYVGVISICPLKRNHMLRGYVAGHYAEKKQKEQKYFYSDNFLSLCVIFHNYVLKGEITHCIESVPKMSHLWGKIDFL